MALLAFASCQKPEVDLLFEKLPEERMNERLTEFRKLLTSSPHGWKLSLNTSGKGGYGFYVNFNEDMTCSMVGDLNNNTSATVQTSTYRVNWAMNASLLFDTFNYITMLQEPSSNFGGTAPNGYKSDIEFEIIESSGDSIYMMGKKYLNLMVLVKASADEKAQYLDNGLAKLKNKHEDYMSNHFNNYVNIEGEENNVDVSFNIPNKTLLLQVLNKEGSVDSYMGKFNYETAILNFSHPVLINDILFRRATLVDDVLTLYDKEGKDYIVKQNQNPNLPLESLYGYNKTNKAIGTPAGVNVLPEVSISSTFPTIIENIITKFGTVKLVDFNFKFEGKNKININVKYFSTAAYTATMSFDYTYENGILTLSNPTGNTSGNWNTRRSVLRELEDYLLDNSPYKVDWVPTSTGVPVGGWYSINDSSNIVYGNLLN